ncbi:hypothetical protein [Paraburkholderia fynbosensis]|uniref:Uncharacterized protein n=1 Tax=Paraburkholderia fynbosensis TaxID=1200993 RepID=A0A6J5FIX6_9BURK|nr:hypothetical protein [Paraburkholderia fynbosensis]CAB3780744.1 hypothetical protein LMG27177_00991 [Paraburkholderia fynbosensis]
MNDTQCDGDFPPLTAGQILDIVVTLREVFGSTLSRAQLTDRLLMFLEDVPGYESGEASSSLIESAWAAYRSRLAGR